MPRLAARPSALRELRREQVLAAARRLAAEEGLEALTIEALERRLAFSRGVITYHFRDKDELLEALLDGAIAEIDAAVLRAAGSAPAPGRRPAAVLEAVLRGFLERREAGRVLLSFWGRIGSDPRIRRKNARLYASYRRRSALLFRRAGRPVGPRERALGTVLVGLVLGLAAQDYFAPGEVDTESALGEAARLAALLAR